MFLGGLIARFDWLSIFAILGCCTDNLAGRKLILPMVAVALETRLPVSGFPNQ